MRDYREGRRAPVHSIHLTFGTCIHNAIEKLKPPPKKESLPLDQVLTEFEEKFRQSMGKLMTDGLVSSEQKDVDELVAAGKNILTYLDSCKELSEGIVLFSEAPLLEKIERTDDIDIKFKGFVDLVLKMKDKKGKTIIYICDWKTCSWGWGKEKRQDEDLQAQLRLYKHFFCKKHNLDPKLVKTAFILLKKRPKVKEEPVEFFPVSTGNVTMMRAVERLNVAISGMESNDYKKNRKACINPFGEKCPYMNTPLCTNDD